MITNSSHHGFTRKVIKTESSVEITALLNVLLDKGQRDLVLTFAADFFNDLKVRISPYCTLKALYSSVCR